MAVEAEAVSSTYRTWWWWCRLKGEGKSGAGQTKGVNDTQDNKYENDGQGGSGGSDGTTTRGGKFGGGGQSLTQNLKDQRVNQEELVL